MRAVTLTVTYDERALFAHVVVRAYNGVSWREILDREVFDQQGLCIATTKAETELEAAIGLPTY